MTTRNVPGTYPSIAAAVAAASSGDSIVVAAGYAGNETVTVTKNNLTFSAPASVTGVVLVAANGVQDITLVNASPMKVVGNAANNTFIVDNDFIPNDGGNILLGGDGNDFLVGGDGNDTLNGGAGDDELANYRGNDSVDGGDGTDTFYGVDLGSSSFTNVEILDTVFTWGSIAQYSSFDRIVSTDPDLTAINITLRGRGGTLDFSTRVSGWNSVNVSASGMTAGYTIIGSPNGDSLGGTQFNDTLYGGDGDYLLGGLGNDSLRGDGTNVTAFYGDAGGGVRVSLAIKGAQNTQSAGNDSLSGIPNLDGSTFDDQLTGDGNDNRLTGGDGNDSLTGGGGGDTLSGDAGSDTARYSSSLAGVAVDLSTKGAQDTGGAGIDTIVSIENLVGSTFDDVLTGNAGANVLDGGKGSDTLKGGDGTDTLSGGDGSDVLTGGRGSDLLTGGDGRDTFAYEEALDSTSRGYDTIVGFNGAAEFFDLPVAVTGIDPAVASGRLSESHFVDDLAAAANAGHLLAHHAVVFTADRGAHAGETFLLVDANGVAGYQAREDFVFRLDTPSNLKNLTTNRFV